jgi:diguanylate cyclase (GGDEF)-like protein/PAS domain S-box-containing protein
MNLLDVRTVIFSYAISNFICMVVIATLFKQNRRHFDGLGFWLADYIMQFGAVLLVALRGRLPDFFWTISNAMIIGGTILLYMGLERFTGNRGRQVHNYLLLAVFIVVHAYFIYIFPSLTVRNILISLGLLAVCAQCAWLLLRKVNQEPLPVTRGVGMVFVLFCFVSLARIGFDLAAPSQNDFFHSNVYDTLSILTYQMLFIILTFNLFLMVNRRLFTDLEEDITTRKQVEAALRLSEEKFFKAFHSSPDAILITRLSDGQIIEVNEGFCNMSGYPREEALANSSIGLALWANPQDRERVVAELQKNHRIRNYEADFRNKSGDILNGLYSGEIIQLGSEVHIFSVVHDITERKQMEAALQESEKRYRTVANYTYDWEYWIAPDQKILYMSPSCERITGYRVEEFVDDPGMLDRIVVAEDRQTLDIHKENAWLDNRKEGLHKIDFRILRRDGEVRWIRHTCQIIHHANGTSLGLRATNRDITESKVAQETIARGRKLLASTLDVLPVGVCLTDESGHYHMLNDAYCAIYEYEREEMLGQHYSVIMPPDQVALANAHYARLLSGDVDIPVERKRQRKDGSIVYIEAANALVESEDGQKMVITTVRDITERKQVEEIQRLRLRLWEYAATHPVDELMQTALDEIGDLTDSPIGFYHFVEEDQNTLSLQAWSTRTLAEFCKAEGKGLHYPIDEAGVWVDCVRERKAVIHNNYASLEHRKGLPAGHAKVIRELVVPTIRNDQIVSILGIGNKSTDYGEKDIELVSYIADIIWSIVEQKRANEQILQLNSKLEQLAMADELTGLFNRRAFFKQGAEEIQRSQRYHSPLSLLMMDIDRFKTINDTYGHDAGDQMLRCVADTLQHHIRNVDTLARLGGEEFGILLPNTEAADAVKLAERLRLAVEQAICFGLEQERSVTVSIGVAKHDEEIQNIDYLLKDADAAMYQAKNQGRNQVVYLG